MPLTRRSFVTAASLGFAHTVGEFGVVLMIGGNIPGETQVLSIALYDYVESLQFAEAHRMAGGLVVFSLALLFFLYRRDRQTAGGCAHERPAAAARLRRGTGLPAAARL